MCRLAPDNSIRHSSQACACHWRLSVAMLHCLPIRDTLAASSVIRRAAAMCERSQLPRGYEHTYEPGGPHARNIWVISTDWWKSSASVCAGEPQVRTKTHGRRRWASVSARSSEWPDSRQSPRLDRQRGHLGRRSRGSACSRWSPCGRSSRSLFHRGRSHRLRSKD